VVVKERRGQRSADGHETRLEELGIPDSEDTLVKIHVATPQT
jgi:hypothetical protein